MTSTFAAAGACSSCPHRGTCHEPRQRIQDPRFTVGRHYECEFYRSIEESIRSQQATPNVVRRGWKRLIVGI